jgi:hypothetical protein
MHDKLVPQLYPICLLECTESNKYGILASAAYSHNKKNMLSKNAWSHWSVAQEVAEGLATIDANSLLIRM